MGTPEGTYPLMKERYLNGRPSPSSAAAATAAAMVRIALCLIGGFRVRAYLIGRKSDLKGDAALNMGLFESLSGEVIECVEKTKPVRTGIGEADIIVDAIFGTGLSKPVGGMEKTVIDAINASGKPVIAVDIPSGIDGATGKALGSAVHGLHTFTYYPKRPVSPGADHSGARTVIDISIPPVIEKEIGFDGEIADGAMIRGFLKRRLPSSHKGSFGHAVVVAGSPGKTGAAHMASLAALKIGAGLVTLVIPESLNAILETKTTEVMTYPVTDDGRGFFTPGSFDEIAAFMEDKDVVIMGPGLSQNEGVMELARRMYREIDKPFVIDADGINAFRGHTPLLKKRGRKTVLTPHRATRPPHREDPEGGERGPDGRRPHLGPRVGRECPPQRCRERSRHTRRPDVPQPHGEPFPRERRKRRYPDGLYRRTCLPGLQPDGKHSLRGVSPRVYGRHLGGEPFRHGPSRP